MANPVIEIFDTWEKLTGMSDGAKRRWKQRIKGLSFAVFGYRGSGKTTILSVMRGRPVTGVYAATPPGGHSIKDFDVTLVDNEDYELKSDKKARIKNINDVSGEERAWVQWAKQY